MGRDTDTQATKPNKGCPSPLWACQHLCTGGLENNLYVQLLCKVNLHTFTRPLIAPTAILPTGICFSLRMHGKCNPEVFPRVQHAYNHTQEKNKIGSLDAVGREESPPQGGKRRTYMRLNSVMEEREWQLGLLHDNSVGVLHHCLHLLLELLEGRLLDHPRVTCIERTINRGTPGPMWCLPHLGLDEISSYLGAGARWPLSKPSSLTRVPARLPLTQGRNPKKNCATAQPKTVSPNHLMLGSTLATVPGATVDWNCSGRITFPRLFLQTKNNHWRAGLCLILSEGS